MNQSFQDQSEGRNQKFLLPLTLLSLSCFLVFLACRDVTALGIASVFAYFLCLVYMTRSRALLIFSIILGLGALLLFGSFTAVAYLLALIGIFGIGAYDLYAFLPCLAVAYGVCWGVTGSPLAALQIFWVVPGVLCLYFALRGKWSRTVAVGALTGGVLLGAVAWLIVSLKVGGSDLTFAGLPAFIAEFRDELVRAIMQSLDTLPEELRSLGGGINEDYLTQMINGIIWFVPAGITVAAELIAFLADFFVLRLSAQFPKREPLPPECRMWKQSSVTALVFGLSFVAMLLAGTSDAGQTIFIAAGNLCAILLPGLGLGGVIRLLLRLRTRGDTPSALSIIFWVVCAVFFFTYIPYFLAFVEVFGLFREWVDSHHKDEPGSGM